MLIIAISPFSVLRTHRVLGPAVAVMTLMFAPSLRHEDVIPRRIILLPGSLSVARRGPSGKSDLITERDRTGRWTTTTRRLDRWRT
ncbi:hypothetical protein ALC57_05806 [Trachymyrmex cornetzi]|uniref:Uncharacterized protein n=1 Tax=Trachymyrmex cornetzi TaxID=471704 RepID=A0A151JA46_9HYME|nr:hypothetical protein ALC57_05806 [Trachymyrmex cornetzi]